MACIPAVFYITATGCLLLRSLARHESEPFSFNHHLFPTHLRIDSLMFGTFLSYLFHYKELGSRIKRIPTPLLVTAGTLLLTPAFVFSLEAFPWVSIVGLDLFALGSGILVIASLRCPTFSNAILRLGGTLGASSYCIYLWHMPVNLLAVWLFERQGHLHFLPYLAFYFSGSLIFGYVFSRLTEIPILHLRDRLFPDSRLNKI
jgi:peptidoglycan/LPS O-acetylase OafA/YrhL